MDRRAASFTATSVCSAPCPTNPDAILCRHVVIYSADVARQKIYNGFARALRRGGLRFIVGSEMIVRSGEIGFRTARTSMCQKAA